MGRGYTQWPLSLTMALKVLAEKAPEIPTGDTW